MYMHIISLLSHTQCMTRQASNVHYRPSELVSYEIHSASDLLVYMLQTSLAQPETVHERLVRQDLLFELLKTVGS